MKISSTVIKDAENIQNLKYYLKHEMESLVYVVIVLYAL